MDSWKGIVMNLYSFRCMEAVYNNGRFPIISKPCNASELAQSFSVTALGKGYRHKRYDYSSSLKYQIPRNSALRSEVGLVPDVAATEIDAMCTGTNHVPDLLVPSAPITFPSIKTSLLR